MQIPVPIGGPSDLNGFLEATTIGIGSMLVLVLATDITEMTFSLGSSVHEHMRRIWPFESEILWPIVPIIGDFEAGAISLVIEAMKAHPTFGQNTG